MNYGYVRVSTDRQTVENQRHEIADFCSREGMDIDGWMEETISGTKNYDKRKLGRLLSRMKEGDLLVCSELSRLGRNLFMIMEILHHCMERGFRVWTVKEGYRLGDDIQSKVLAFAFSLSAEIERKLISERTKAALRRLKEEGTHLGRPVGSKNLHAPTEGKERKIDRMLASGASKSEVARRTKISRSTLYKYLKNKEKGHQQRCPELTGVTRLQK